MQARALLVDDEPTILLTLGLVLKSEGFDVQNAESAEIAKSYLVNTNFELVVADLNLEHPLSGFRDCQACEAKAHPTSNNRYQCVL